jgi:ribosomal protein S18 acetylase RimI-like enzyme
MSGSVRIERVDHTQERVARAIHAVQMSAYAQEAELLGAVDFPPLLRTVADVRTCEEEFFVAYVVDELVAGLSVCPDPEGMGRNLASLVVAPPFQRRCIASSLMAEVLLRYGASTLTVQTGARNTPALTLYARAGFVELRRWLVGKEPLELVKLRRLPQSGAQPSACAPE